MDQDITETLLALRDRLNTFSPPSTDARKLFVAAFVEGFIFASPIWAAGNSSTIVAGQNRIEVLCEEIQTALHVHVDLAGRLDWSDEKITNSYLRIKQELLLHLRQLRMETHKCARIINSAIFLARVTNHIVCISIAIMFAQARVWRATELMVSFFLIILVGTVCCVHGSKR